MSRAQICAEMCQFYSLLRVLNKSRGALSLFFFSSQSGRRIIQSRHAFTVFSILSELGFVYCHAHQKDDWLLSGQSGAVEPALRDVAGNQY